MGKFGKFIVVIVALVAALIIIPNILPASASDAEIHAKNRVAKHLKDPDSAQFSGVEFHAYENSESSRLTGYVCGSVNAKNSYGGYGGDIRFIVDVEVWNNGRSSKTSELLMDDADLDAFKEAWRARCT